MLTEAMLLFFLMFLTQKTDFYFSFYLMLPQREQANKDSSIARKALQIGGTQKCLGLVRSHFFSPLIIHRSGMQSCGQRNQEHIGFLRGETLQDSFSLCWYSSEVQPYYYCRFPFAILIVLQQAEFFFFSLTHSFGPTQNTHFSLQQKCILVGSDTCCSVLSGSFMVIC